MKKIKIITFQNAHNYGALLQAYALQNVLQNENNVEIINYKNDIIGNQYKIFKVSKKNIKSFIKSILKNILFYLKNVSRYKVFYKFEKEKLKLTKEYTSEILLKEDAPEADIYITGSDQVWNSNITDGLQDSYTLNFGNENIKRISYAASIGKSIIAEDEKDVYTDKISKIDYISVREEDGKKALAPIINKSINVVLDPTLLLNKEKWENEIENLDIEKEKYILAYVVEDDDEFFKITNELSEKTGLKIVHFGLKNKGYNNVLRSAYTEGPLEFVNLIRNAEYVVCTSFHATVFSIIFNKKFFVVPHRKTGARVTNLLDKLNISNRAVNSLDEFNKMNYNSEINYKEVNKTLENERNKSLDWLNNAINN